jgi:hypothetical protein
MFHMLHPEHGEPMPLSILRDAGYHVFWGGKNDVVPGQMSMKPHAETWSDKSRYDLQPNGYGPVYQEARGTREDDTYHSFYIGRMEKKPGERYYHDNDSMHVQEATRLIRNRPDDRPLYHTKAAMCRTAGWKHVQRFGESDGLHELRKRPAGTLQPRGRPRLCGGARRDEGPHAALVAGDV